MKTIKHAIILLALCGFAIGTAHAAELVTPDNFNRAETDFYIKKKVDEGMFGKIVHIREPASIDKQLIVRMNRDTFYSFGVFDLT
jgi:hypothetical protein